MIHGQNETKEPFQLSKCTNLYEYLGAHITETDDKRITVFRVWAPNAKSVSVILNNRETFIMTRTDNGVWEFFSENAKELDDYRYIIETADGERLEKSDPCAFHAKLRPETDSVIYTLEGYEWNDSDWLEKRSTADYFSLPLNIYELHLGSWRRNENGEFLGYRQIAEELIPYIKEMNYTHVNLLPITEHPYDQSLGYQPTGCFAATSRHGAPHDLMYLIDELHKADIGVILDWVPTGFPKDEFGLVKFDGSSLYENSNPLLGECISRGICLFDYSKPEVISFLISSAVFWLEKFHFDGIRIGALTSMLYLDYGKENSDWQPNKFGGKENLEAIDFLKQLNHTIHERFKGVLLFGDEHTSWPKLTYPIEEGGLGFDFKWNKGWITDMINYISLPPQWRPFNHDNLTYSFFYAFSERYVLPISHDEIARCRMSIQKQRSAGDPVTFAEFRAFFTYMYAHPGKKLIFMGTEIGQLNQWNCESQLEWERLGIEKCAQLNRFFSELNRFYLSSPPLYELDASWKGFDWIHHDDFTNSVIAFKRMDKSGNEIIAVCNFQPVRHDQYYIGVTKPGLYDEVFSSDEPSFGGNGITNGRGIAADEMKIHGCNFGISLTLPPLGAVYLKYSDDN